MCELAIESAYSAILGNLGACQVVISSLNRALEPPVVEDQDHLLAIECALRAVVSLATEASNILWEHILEYKLVHSETLVDKIKQSSSSNS